MQNRKAATLLRHGAPLILTLTPQGPSYSIDGHGTVASKYAQALTRADPMPGPKQADLFLTPNEDGLFPGFSQTWQA